MGFEYDIIDGQRVEKNVAAAYRKAAAAFKERTGLDVKVTSGVRTEEEQREGYEDMLAGRTSVKWAKPSESSHCEIGPSGPRALDLRDTGQDYGLTRKGTERWHIWQEVAAPYGFTWGGWGVPDSEGWHHENHAVTVGAYGGTPAAAVQTSSRPDPGVVVKGWNWNGIAAMLRRYDGYRGNNTPGPVMIAALQRFLNRLGYAREALGHNLRVDGDFGDNTAAATQEWLRQRWGYTGQIDSWFGDGTHAAWNRAEAANWIASPQWRA